MQKSTKRTLLVLALIAMNGSMWSMSPGNLDTLQNSITAMQERMKRVNREITVESVILARALAPGGTLQKNLAAHMKQNVQLLFLKVTHNAIGYTFPGLCVLVARLILE